MATIIVGLTIGLMGLIIMYRAFVYEPRAVEVTRHAVTVSRGNGSRPFRLVQLTDLHLHRYGLYEQTIVGAVAELQPDLIALTGDYAENEAGLQALATMVRAWRRMAPVVVVLGDNDMECRTDMQRTTDALVAAGATLLRNDGAIFPGAGGHILVLGVDDPNSRLSKMDAAWFAGRRALAAAGLALDQIPVVLLAHSPEIVVEMTGPLDLVLTGHTHGGQICLPGGKALHTNTPRCRGYASGMYEPQPGTALYVNRGIGTARIPARLFCRPEIALFHLARNPH